MEGNVKGKYILNYTMAEPNGPSFGDAQESISEAIGRNNRFGKTRRFRLWVSNQLNRAEHDHCEQAVIQANERIRQKFIKNIRNEYSKN